MLYTGIGVELIVKKSESVDSPQFQDVIENDENSKYRPKNEESI